MTEIIITFNDTEISDKELATLMESCGYGLASSYLSVTNFKEKFFCQGTVNAFAILKKQLIGMARVFTDDITTTYLSEVCVQPDYQGKGIESQLIKAITHRCGHTSIFTVAFETELDILAENAITPKSKITACSRKRQFENIQSH